MPNIEPIELPKGLRSKVEDATPRPVDVFRGYASGGYRLADAIAEYVDNAMDQVTNRSHSGLARISVDFAVQGATFHVLIKDNCGGCPRGDAKLFIQPGGTGTTATQEGISRFGMGGKTAGLSVAKSVRIFSHHPTDSGFLAILDKQELMTKTDWNFPIYDLPTAARLESGSTLIDLVDVPSEAHANRAKIRAEFGERYALLLKDSNSPEIYVDGERVVAKNPSDCMLQGAEAPEGCSPVPLASTEYYSLPTGTDARHKVGFSMIVGLGPEGSTTPEKGARIYCNGRRVGPIVQLGMGSDDDSSLHTTSDFTWLRAVVAIQGPVELLPWTNRKDRLDPQSPSYRDLERKLRVAYDDFLDKNVANARTRLREHRGKGGKLPPISEVLEGFWRAQIERKALDPTKVRHILRDAPTFRKAARASEEGTIPGPPDKKGRGLVPLHAEVDGVLVQEAKELIAKRFGKAEVTNADVVRTSLEHLLQCDLLRQEEPDGDE
jgi:Histidine kinase-, DNA gyrase B-, and HSP90-like ATPase